ncbi:MAG: DNA glycosylase AlkZ-like family protein, partial [Candidatus Limnocylindrales bacterium]
MAVATPMDARQLLLRRSASQLLGRRIDGEPETAVRALLAVQAQDRMSWRLALRVRVAGITAGDVNRALTEKRSLVVSWLNRGTLHLVCSEDYPWLLALTSPTQVSANARRLSQEGLAPDDVAAATWGIKRE